METTHLSTAALPTAQRLPFVRDAAFNLFNLEADFEGSAAGQVHADIRVMPGALMSVVDVHTSWSVVRRTPARAAASPMDHLLLYVVAQGGSWFRNERDEQFLTRPGSIVVGSQASPYTAAAAAGHDWRFRVIRIAADRLPTSGDPIRRRGFSLLRDAAPMTHLVSQYVGSVVSRLPDLGPHEVDASVQALDLLLAASLGHDRALEHDGGRAIGAARLVAARNFIERCVEDPRLGPERVAAHLALSPRQVHRLFASQGTSLSLEIRRLRVARAQALLMREPARPVTDIAYACGFDSLATFYRCFRAETGTTATEWRAQPPT